MHFQNSSKHSGTRSPDSVAINLPKFGRLKREWEHDLTQTDIKIESVTEHAGRTLRARRGTVSMWSKFISTLCLPHYSFIFGNKSRNNSYPSKWQTGSQHFYQPSQQQEWLFLCEYLQPERAEDRRRSQRYQRPFRTQSWFKMPNIPRTSVERGGGYSASLTHVHSARLTHISQQYACLCLY